MSSYGVRYNLAWVVFVAGLVASGIVIAGPAALGLSPTQVAWAGLLTAVCTSLAAVLPEITRTPEKRRATRQALRDEGRMEADGRGY